MSKLHPLVLLLLLHPLKVITTIKEDDGDGGRVTMAIGIVSPSHHLSFGPYHGSIEILASPPPRTSIVPSYVYIPAACCIPTIPIYDTYK